MAKSGHVDTFTRDNLPPRAEWPEFKFDLPELQYPERLNCVTHWVDHWVEAGQGDRPCLLSPTETLTYAQLNERVNRIANVLTRDLGMVPGNRVLLRAANNCSAPRSCPIRWPRQRSRWRSATRGLPTRWRRPRRSRPN